MYRQNSRERHELIGSDEYFSVVEKAQGVSPRGDPELAPLERISIYSLETLTNVRDTQGIKEAVAMVTGPRSIGVQALVFLAATFAQAFHGLVMEWALFDDETKSKKLIFLPFSLYLFSYSLSLILSNIIAFYGYGRKGVKDAWGYKAIILFAPSALLYLISEVLDIFILLNVAADTKGIFLQLRIPMIAIMSVFLLNRKQTTAQWMCLVGLTTSVIGYSLAKANMANVFNTVGVASCLSQSFFLSVGAVVVEMTFGRCEFPFAIQMAQQRVTSVVSTSFCLVLYCWYYNCFDRIFFSQWTSKIFILGVWYVYKDYANHVVVKVLSSLWKVIAGAVGLCLCYIAQTLLRGNHWEPVLICFILCTILNVFTYTFTSRMNVELKSVSSERDGLKVQVDNLLITSSKSSLPPALSDKSPLLP